MGEARRRKLLDPNYGKPVLSLEIELFSLVRMYGIVCCNSGCVLDSAANRDEAIAIKAVFELLACKYPLNRYNESTWRQWIKDHFDQILVGNKDLVILPDETAIVPGIAKEMRFKKWMTENDNPERPATNY